MKPMVDPAATPPNVPYGAWPRLGNGFFVALLVLFAAWFGGLIWLACAYPAPPH